MSAQSWRDFFRSYGVLFLAALILLGGLGAVSRYNFVLFHTLAEGFSIAVACALFVVAWNTWAFAEVGYLHFLGIAFFFIAGLDFVHTLAYQELRLFPGYAADLSAQLWIAARGLQSLSLLVAPDFLHREANRYALFGLYALITAGLLAAIFGGLFPVCYVMGQGFTPFKVASEYGITLLLGVALLRLVRHRAAFSTATCYWLAASIALTILSDLAFVGAVSDGSFSSFAGHVFKLGAFYCLYHAVVETGLRQPFALLFRDLHQHNTRLEREIAERELVEGALQESEARVRRKLNAILLPEGDIGALELADIIDVPAIQSMMDDFYALTQIGIALLDLRGKVLVATGWQDICTQFHRVHPETRANCIESDTRLSQGVELGTFRAYRCKNNMWDIVTPIAVGGDHVGNLFLGQFFYTDEVPDEAFFRAQARRYGFEGRTYLAAMRRVPRWDRARVDTVMRFYARLAQQISSLSYANLKLARTLTERDHLLASLRVSETRFRTLFETMTEGFALHEIIYDAAGVAIDYRILDANPAYARHTGLAVAAVRGKRASEVYRTGDPPYLARYAAVSRTGEPDFFEVYFPPLLRHFRISVFSPRRGQFATVFEDITERKQAQEKLREYAHHLEQRVDEKVRQLEEERAKAVQMDKLAALGEMATSIAHELKQPLTVIGIEAGYLWQVADTAERERITDLNKWLDVKALASIGESLENNIERCRRIIDHLRDFGRISRDAPTLVNVNQTIENSFILVDARLRESKVTVRTDLADALPHILADPYKLEQVFINLINNAEHALAKQAGAVDADYQKTLHIATRVEGDTVIATVRDNGCGIPADIRARIFDPFFTTKPRGEGTGLGLSISYGIVADFAGEIECESTPGEGTTFTLRFPVACA